jgi:CubicO group peptidase (beta-lactamase class C family)
VAEQGRIPGVAIAVARRGETVYEGGFGFRDVERELPATPATVFGIGSVTKSMTALAIMHLAEAGRLSPHDPVTRWLPEFRLPHPAGDEPVTVHHLLTHSSGMPPEPSLLHARAASMKRDPDLYHISDPPLPEGFADLQEVDGHEALMELMAGQDFVQLGPPGRWFSYSNEGFALLHGIIERAGGRPYLDYLRDNIWSPLAMPHTGSQAEARAGFPTQHPALSTQHSPPVTTLYARRKDDGSDAVIASPAWHDIGRIYGNGGLASTVRDLIRYLEVYRVDGAGIVSRGAVAEMTAPHIAVPTGGFYGYGLRVHTDYHGVRVVEHGGGNKGIAAHVLVAGDDITVACLTNLGGAPAQKISMGALNALLSLPLDTPLETFPEYAPDDGEMARLLGTYTAERQSLRIFLDDGRLAAEVNGKRVPVRPFAPDGLVLGEETPVRFLTDDSGAVWAASMGLRILPRQ